MKPVEVLKATKKVADHGNWRTGSIDRASWPMKKKKLRQSADWSWRVICFDGNAAEYRVLLKLNESIEQFYAIFGALRGDGIAVLCSHKLHTSHGDWHCHAATTDIENVFVGAWRDKYTLRRWPSYSGDCRVEFNVDRLNAMNIAASLYRFNPPDQAEMLL